jgi:hypothetical protein
MDDNKKKGKDVILKKEKITLKNERWQTGNIQFTT